MSIYNVYVRTCHGNERCFEVCACSDAAAKREGEEYGRVLFVLRLHAVRKVLA